MKSSVFSVTICILFSSLLLASGLEGAKPNIVLLLVDDMGWKDLACYGSDTHRTPHIDQLAEESVRFTQAYAPATVCSPTRAALLTGQSPARLHLTDWIEFGKDFRQPFASMLEAEFEQRLNPAHDSLAEKLKAEGYTTAHIGKWHLGGEGSTPTDHGFDLNIGGTEHGFPPGGFHLPNGLDLPGAHEGEYLTDHLTSRAVELVDQFTRGEKPFFLNFWYYTVHKPIEGKSALAEHYEKTIQPGAHHSNPHYAAMVHSLDESVGRILAALEANGIANETVVILTSDNGGLSHNYGTRDPVTDNYPLRRGKGSAYEGGLRVPLIVRWPGVSAHGVCDDPVIGTDLFATLMAQLGLPHDAPIDGMDLTALLRDPEESLPRQALHWHYPHYHPGGDGPSSIIRMDDWKLIERLEDGSLELYHLTKDPGELWNVARRYPMVAGDLRKRLALWREETGARMPTQNPDYDPARSSEIEWAKTR